MKKFREENNIEATLQRLDDIAMSFVLTFLTDPHEETRRHQAAQHLHLG